MIKSALGSLFPSFISLCHPHIAEVKLRFFVNIFLSFPDLWLCFAFPVSLFWIPLASGSLLPTTDPPSLFSLLGWLLVYRWLMLLMEKQAVWPMPGRLWSLITDSHSFSGTQLLRFRYVKNKTKALDASLYIYTVKMESQLFLPPYWALDVDRNRNRGVGGRRIASGVSHSGYLEKCLWCSWLVLEAQAAQAGLGKLFNLYNVWMI